MYVRLFCEEPECAVCLIQIIEAGYRINYDGHYFTVVNIMDGLTVLPLHTSYEHAVRHVETLVGEDR